MRSLPRLGFRLARDAWSLWWPCKSCGGNELPLLARFDAEDLLEALVATADQMHGRPRPGCHCRRKRAEHDGGEAEVWYDVDLTDSVRWVPLSEDSAGLILPRGIRSFDASPALVRCAIATLYGTGTSHPA